MALYIFDIGIKFKQTFAELAFYKIFKRNINTLCINI